MERGLIPSEKLISHQLPLAEWERAFGMAERQEGVKLLLHPEDNRNHGGGERDVIDHR